MKNNKEFIQFEEYYENSGRDRKEFDYFNQNNQNEYNNHNEYNKQVEYNHNISQNQNNYENDDLQEGDDSYGDNYQYQNNNDNLQHSIEDKDREEIENDYELIKSLNELKDRNKKLESINKYQSVKIETLENELDKAMNEIKVREMELSEIKAKSSGNNLTSPEYKKTVSQMNQINNLNVQVDKYKNMLSEKKNEFTGLLDKYNEMQKIVDKYQVTERKTKQEVINKDKQIARLIEELDKKSGGINNNANMNMNMNNKAEVEKLTNELKKCEKQKNDLYVAFKKSIKLCSILKRQKVHLENARLLAFTEDEFRNLLEQNKI